VCFGISDEHISTLAGPLPGFIEHRVGFADAGIGPEKHLELSTPGFGLLVGDASE